jgi:hypothetical protein
MQDKGLDPEDRRVRTDFIRRILWCFIRMNQQGRAEKIGHGLGARYRLTLAATK